MSDFTTMSNLVADAEDLLGKLSDSRSPEVRKLRAEVRSSIAELRRMFRQKLKEGADSADGFAHRARVHIQRRPFLTAAGAATVAAVAFGLIFLVSTRRGAHR